MAYILFLSFNIMFMRCIHVVVGSCCSFILIAIQFSMVCIHHNGFICSTVWAFGLSQFRAIVISAAMNILVYFFGEYKHIFVGYVLGMEILGYMVKNMARFSTSYYLFKVVVLIHIPTRSV